jgi:small subunit ribosomal protein S5
MHDFHSRFGANRIQVHKAPKGYGLVCHRAIRSTCEIIGIKDLHAKMEMSGRKNIQNLIKAFFLGLMRQVLHN